MPPPSHLSLFQCHMVLFKSDTKIHIFKLWKIKNTEVGFWLWVENLGSGWSPLSPFWLFFLSSTSSKPSKGTVCVWSLEAYDGSSMRLLMISLWKGLLGLPGTNVIFIKKKMEQGAFSDKQVLRLCQLLQFEGINISNPCLDFTDLNIFVSGVL